MKVFIIKDEEANVFTIFSKENNVIVSDKSKKKALALFNEANSISQTIENIKKFAKSLQ